MQVTFIGFAFLCGVGLGSLAVLVLTTLRRATLQRTKWARLVSAVLSTSTAIAVILYVALSPTQEERLRQRFELIPNPNYSSQWYEYTHTASSATGECASTSTDRWFGLNTGSDERVLMDWYSRQLIDNGWQLENTVWRKDTSTGVFTLGIKVFTDVATIDPQQWFYTITDDVLKQASQYATVYVLRLNLMSNEARARCLGQSKRFQIGHSLASR